MQLIEIHVDFNYIYKNKNKINIEKLYKEIEIFLKKQTILEIF